MTNQPTTAPNLETRNRRLETLQPRLGLRFFWPRVLAVLLLLLPSALLQAQWPTPDEFNPGANDFPYAIAVQSDGKILVGGIFTSLGGQSQSHLGRLNPNGTVDVTFKGSADYDVHCLAVQPDGKILVGGDFLTLSGQIRSRLGRLNPDGTLDPDFNPGADNRVACMAVQPDGKILVGGAFTTVAGQRCLRLARLESDGTLDLSFSATANGLVLTMALQPDGKILVGGTFGSLNGKSRARIGRLNPDGSLDQTFNPGADKGVVSVALQADNKILVGGDFTTLGGLSRSRIGRLNPDGSVDPEFNPGATGSLAMSEPGVFCIVVQTDGKILVGGSFTNLGAAARSALGRLNPDGSVDPDFDPGANRRVRSIALQTDGKTLVTGEFGTLAGQPRRYVARLNNTEPAMESLTVEGSTIRWLRGGTGPEVWRTTFEVSTNGLDWVSLGQGTRISGGWQLTGLSIPANARVRARGWTTGGQYNGSVWFVEAGAGPPWMVSQPTSQTNQLASVARFHAWALGTGPLSYQWFRDGSPLADGGKVTGAGTATLTLSNVAGSEMGAYWVVVSGLLGSVTSAVAHLTVLDPWISSQPQSADRNPGESVTLSVAAVGTPPFSYQWYQDGAPVPGATESALVLTNLRAADAGRYWAVVSNPYWSATSQVALLTVNVVTVDPEFDPGADSDVLAMAVQPDGKILLGGDFTWLGGQSRSYLGRLNPDGTLDPGFDPGADRRIRAFSVQPDRKILVGGLFRMLAGQSRSCFAQLEPDGTLVPGFDAQADGSVWSMALQPDGGILVGGFFTSLAGQPRSNIGRVNPDGTVDARFSPDASSGLYCMAVEPDGKILVGGWFTNLAGHSRARIGRLYADGTVDPDFNPGVTGGTGDPYVACLVPQPDGKILVGGRFGIVGGQSRSNIARLNPDGSVDLTFDPCANDRVSSIALQSDGKILVGGWFTSLAGRTRFYIARLQPDGSLDPTFNPGADLWVRSVALQPDGKILLGGSFTNLAGQPRRCVARLNNTGPAMESLTVEGSTIRWLRGGTGPEVWRTTFEVSTNGLDWVSLGQGTRIPGGWQLSGIALPPHATVRARGWVRAAYHASSEWFVESLAPVGAPLRLSISQQGAQVVLSWSGGRGPYQVQQNRDLSEPAGWTDLGEPVHTNSITLPIGPGKLFLRVRGQ